MYSIIKKFKKVIIALLFVLTIVGFSTGIYFVVSQNRDLEIGIALIVIGSISAIVCLGMVFSKDNRAIKSFNTSVEKTVIAKKDAEIHAKKAMKAVETHNKHKEKVNEILK